MDEHRAESDEIDMQYTICARSFKAFKAKKKIFKLILHSI